MWQGLVDSKCLFIVLSKEEEGLRLLLLRWCLWFFLVCKNLVIVISVLLLI